jgi:hypothetical protein
MQISLVAAPPGTIIESYKKTQKSKGNIKGISSLIGASEVATIAWKASEYFFKLRTDRLLATISQSSTEEPLWKLLKHTATFRQINEHSQDTWKNLEGFVPSP